jgi:hypothetical protein
MPGLEPTVAREPIHSRQVELRGYKREDGLYDIEGHLVDTKSIDFKLAAGLRPAGQPIHDMWLRITIDRTLTIVDAAAAMDAMPYVGDCSRIVPAYKLLVGLAIRPGFHQRIKELLGGVRGCTHVTELAGALATAAFQTMAGQRKQELLEDPDKKPFQLDRCHALALTSPAVARYYPKWYRGDEAIDPAAEADHH